ncbi:MAG: glycosyltransferase family 39 protein [Pleurocapsa minor GSE-CHR-MK-17-07R]|jgi:hypothetical protein|nr:glycosyltransferase family 39 protein [Pleurocapsa minor GSE-CHR-MK 17-07R]
MEQSKRRSLLGWIGLLLVAAATLVALALGIRALALLVGQSVEAINYPYQLNYGEGPLLDQSLRIARGAALYSLDVPPYTITNYPPLFAALQAPWQETYGIAFFYGRIISLASVIVSVLAMTGLVRALTKSWLAGLVSGALLAAVPYLFHWSALARVDNLALALSLAGLFCVAQGRDNRWGVFLGALLIALSAATRQSYLLAAPLAAFVFLLMTVGAYRAFYFVVWLGLLILLPFAVALVWTEGGIWFHLVTANTNALSSVSIEKYAAEIALTMPVLLGMGLLFLLFGWIRKGPRSAWALAAPYVVGGIVSALTIAKVGSDVNYLFELCAALCVLGGVFSAALGRIPVLRVVAVLGLAFQVVTMQTLSELTYAPIIAERLAQRAEMDVLAALVRDETGVILADDAMGLLALSNRPVLFQPFEFTQLESDGVWDESDFVARLERGAYPVVILHTPYRNPRLRFERWTPEMLRIINDNFRVAAQYAEHTVYRYAAG